MKKGILIWEDKNGEIQINEKKMTKWFAAAIENLRVLEMPKEDAAWVLFLMGAEAVLRGNYEESKEKH